MLDDDRLTQLVNDERAERKRASDASIRRARNQAEDFDLAQVLQDGTAGPAPSEATPTEEEQDDQTSQFILPHKPPDPYVRPYTASASSREARYAARTGHTEIPPHDLLPPGETEEEQMPAALIADLTLAAIAHERNRDFIKAFIGHESPVTSALVADNLEEAVNRTVSNMLFRGSGLAQATQPEIEAMANITMRQLMQSGVGREGLKSELKQLLDYHCLLPRHHRDLSARERENVATSHAFGRVKPATDQVPEKLKVRNVIHGHKVRFSAVPDVSSPCVRQSSIFLMLAILAAGHKLDPTFNARAHDVKGAYLQTAMPKDDSIVPIVLAFRGEQKALLFELNPAFKEYDTAPDGAFYAEATRAVYGIGEAGLLWHNHLHLLLTERMSFADGRRLHRLQSDPCVYMLRSDEDDTVIEAELRGAEARTMEMLDAGMEGQAGDAQALALSLERIKAAGLEIPSLVCTWVDDLLTIGQDNFLESFQVQLSDIFAQGIVSQTLTSQTPITYVSMRIAYEPEGKGVTIDQEKMIRDMGPRYGVTDTQKYPCNEDIFDIDESSTPLDQIRLKRFQSAAMAALFVARFTRNDGLMTNSFLASRLHCPTVQDEAKLDHYLSYLIGSADLKTCINPDSLQLEGKVDASYAVHPDGKGQHGIIVSMRNMGGSVVVRSVKQKLVTRSSSESEFVALHDAGPSFVECKNFMDEIGLAQEPIEVEQDNQASIMWSNVGASAYAV